jgi:hypothetical protein
MYSFLICTILYFGTSNQMRFFLDNVYVYNRFVNICGHENHSNDPIDINIVLVHRVKWYIQKWTVNKVKTL